jgi:hypothetical protein
LLLGSNLINIGINRQQGLPFFIAAAIFRAITMRGLYLVDMKNPVQQQKLPGEPNGAPY